MIDRLGQWSRRLAFLRPVLIALGIAGAGFFALELFFAVIPGNDDVLLIPGSLTVLWSLVGYTGLSIFPGVPPATSDRIGWLARLKLYLVRFGCYLLAFVFLLLTIATVYLSLRLIGIWLRT